MRFGAFSFQLVRRERRRDEVNLDDLTGTNKLKANG